MAHLRKRHLSDYCEKLLRFSPIVGVFGHRQVGKTTYTSGIAGSYLTFDDVETRKLAHMNPKKFIKTLAKGHTKDHAKDQKKFPCVIDECQLEPDLFPSLKEHVRLNKKPGQFLLTGSVRFSSRKAIRESLTGRILQLEMLPLTVSELSQDPLSDVVPQLLKCGGFDSNTLALSQSSSKRKSMVAVFEKYLSQGGLPGLCFVREEKLRRENLNNLIQLILDRDLRLIMETRLSLRTLQDFLVFIAKNAWNPYNASEVKRQLGLATETQQNLLYALESIYLIRRIPIQPRSGAIYLLEDQIEELILSEKSLSVADQKMSAFYRNMSAQFAYRMGDAIGFQSYWTRDGARVPLVIRSENKSLGFLVTESGEPSLSQKRSAASFLRHHAEGKVIYLTSGALDDHSNGYSNEIHDSRSASFALVDLI